MFFSCQNKTAHLWREKRNGNRKSNPLKLPRKMQTKRLAKIIAQFVFTRRIICAFSSSSSTFIPLRDQVTECWVLWNYHTKEWFIILQRVTVQLAMHFAVIDVCWWKKWNNLLKHFDWVILLQAHLFQFNSVWSDRIT